MKLGYIDTPTIQSMEHYMDFAARKQTLTAANLANIDTPGYRTMDFSMELAISEATNREPGVVLRRQDPRHYPGAPLTGLGDSAFEVDGLPQRNDGNNVDLDREMLSLSRTAAKFSLITQLMRSELRKLQHAITEGK